MTLIFSVQCVVKQLLDSVFVISRIIEVSVRVISLSLRLRLITPTSTSIILDITKTSSNNCLLQTELDSTQSYYHYSLMHTLYFFVRPSSNPHYHVSERAQHTRSHAHAFPDSHLSPSSSMAACFVPSPQEYDVSAVFGFVPESEPLVSIFFIRKEKKLYEF